MVEVDILYTQSLGKDEEVERDLSLKAKLKYMVKFFFFFPGSSTELCSLGTCESHAQTSTPHIPCVTSPAL